MNQSLNISSESSYEIRISNGIVSEDKTPTDIIEKTINDGDLLTITCLAVNNSSSGGSISGTSPEYNLDPTIPYIIKVVNGDSDLVNASQTVHLFDNGIRNGENELLLITAEKDEDDVVIINDYVSDGDTIIEATNYVKDSVVLLNNTIKELIKKDLIKDLNKNSEELISDLDKNCNELATILDKNTKLLINDFDKNTSILKQELQTDTQILKQELNNDTTRLIQELNDDTTRLINDLDYNTQRLIDDLDYNTDRLIEDLDKNTQAVIDCLNVNFVYVVDELKRIGNLLELYPERIMKETAMRLFAESEFDEDKSAEQLADDAIERAGIFTKKLFKALPFKPKSYEYEYK